MSNGYVPTQEDEWHAEVLLQTVAGLDTTSPHGAATPARFVSMLKEMTSGNVDNVRFTVFPNETDKQEMVVLTPIPFYSLCNHHVVPFYGQAHVAYIPNEHLCGLSKLGRVVKEMSRGLWVQEELTVGIASFLQDALDPIGVAVVMQAEHLCMAMRGIEMAGVVTTTTCMKGAFLDPTKQARQEFLSLIRSGK